MRAANGGPEVPAFSRVVAELVGTAPALRVADAEGAEGSNQAILFPVDAGTDRRRAGDCGLRHGGPVRRRPTWTIRTPRAGWSSLPANGGRRSPCRSWDDDIEDSGETFTLILSSPSGAVLADAEATGTIYNRDDIAPALSVGDASAAEGDAIEFTVSLSEQSGQQVTVEYATSGGTATSGTDFTAASDTLTFEPGATSKTVSVSTTDDSEDEEDETFSLTLSNPTNATLDDTTATGTINDDDDEAPAPLSGFTLVDADTHTDIGPIADGASFTFVDPANGSYGIRAEPAPGAEIGSVRFALSGAKTASRTETSAPYSLYGDHLTNVRGEGLPAGSYTLTATAYTGSRLDGRELGTLEVSFTVTAAQRPALSVADASATEGDAVEFTVSLSEQSGQQVTVEYATSGGTATSGTDFTAAADTLTFEPGETSKTVSVSTTDDSDDEDGETFTLTLSNPTNATLADTTATGTINDDDGAPAPLTATFNDMPDSHDGTSAFTFGLEFTEDVGISYRTLRDSAFSVTNGTVTRAGRVDGRNDLWAITVQPESNEAVTVTLPGDRDCGTTGAVCTSGDNPRPLSNSPSDTVDGPGAPTNTAPAGAPTIGGTAQVGETLAASVSDISDADGLENASFGYQWIRGSTDIQDATDSTYTLVSADEGERIKVRVAFTDDAGHDETLTSSATDAVAGPPALSAADASATEGDAVQFTVSLSKESSRQVTVQYATSGGTATSGTDFTAASDTLTFAANETSKTVSISTTDDSDDEDDETFTLTLSSPTNATLADEAATGTIIDDDEAPPPLTGFTLVDAATDTDIGVITGGASFTLADPANGSYGIRADPANGAEIGSVGLALSGAKTASRTENSAPYSLYGDDGTNVHGEGLPAGSYLLTATAYAEAWLGGQVLGVLAVSFTVTEAPSALTATFSDMPTNHTGEDFMFTLTFSEDFSLSYTTLRDSAFRITDGAVQKAQRKQQGSNIGWNITVKPSSANDAVIIELPETIDCNASRAICTADRRPLSHSLADTVVSAASGSASDARGGDMVDDALALLGGVTPDDASAALFGGGGLSEAQLDALDRLGNRNGRYDLGDMLSWRDRCRTGRARCGGTSTDPGPTSSAFLFGAAAARRRRTSGRMNRRSSGHRRLRGSACRIAALLAAITAWSCTGDLVGPPAAEPDPGARAAERPIPATAPQGPGFLTVEWTAPAASRAVGVLLELEGPGIEAVQAPGLELFQSGTAGQHRIVVAGPLDAGPIVRFQVPDRGRVAEYRVRVLEVTGEDYRLSDVGRYRAALTSN